MRSSLAADSRSISRACVSRSSPHAATGSSRSRNSARSISAAKSPVDSPACCAPAGVGHTVPHQRRCIASSRSVRARAGGAREPRRVDAGQLARVLRRLDRQQAVRALGVGELGGRQRVEVDVARRRPVALGLAGERGAQHRPRLALEDLALEREQQRRGLRGRAHEHLLARLHVEAVAGEQRGEPPRVRRHPTIAAARHQPAEAPGDLDRQAGDGEAGRARQRAEVVELLDLAVLVVDAGAVRLPQDRGVAGRARTRRAAP